MSNPRPELIKVYLKSLLASLEEKQKTNGGMMMEHCKRPDGSTRAWFTSREEAEWLVPEHLRTMTTVN